MVRRLAGATALTLSEVVQRLQLSDQQQAQIRRIVNGTIENMRRLRLEAASKGVQRRQFAQRRDELLSESRRQALDLLTPKQAQSGTSFLTRGTPATCRSPPTGKFWSGNACRCNVTLSDHLASIKGTF